jgi:hypothetical protein
MEKVLGVKLPRPPKNWIWKCFEICLNFSSIKY